MANGLRHLAKGSAETRIKLLASATKFKVAPVSMGRIRGCGWGSYPHLPIHPNSPPIRPSTRASIHPSILTSLPSTELVCVCKFPVLLFTAARNQIKQLLPGVSPLRPSPIAHRPPHPLDYGATSRENHQLKLGSAIITVNVAQANGIGAADPQKCYPAHKWESVQHQPCNRRTSISWLIHSDVWYSNFERGDGCETGRDWSGAGTFLTFPSIH